MLYAYIPVHVYRRTNLVSGVERGDDDFGGVFGGFEGSTLDHRLRSVDENDDVFRDRRRRFDVPRSGLCENKHLKQGMAVMLSVYTRDVIQQ